MYVFNLDGDYPAVMKEYAGDHIPSFTAEESEQLKGSYDLLMLNHYSSKLVTDCNSPMSSKSCESLDLGWAQDLAIDDSKSPKGARLSSMTNGKHNCAWFRGYPQGYSDTIRWMHAHDPEAKILLTENGW